MSTRNLPRNALRAVCAVALVAGSVITAGQAVAQEQGVAQTAETATLAPLDVNSTKAQKRDGYNILEVNLCASGDDKDCYDRRGASLKGALALIEEEEPQGVVFTEACSTHMETLMHAVRDANPRRFVHSAFRQVRDDKGNTIKCDRGGNYGVGVVDSVLAKDNKGYNAWWREYDGQAKGDEKRLALCSLLNGSHYTCATDLSNNRRTATNQLEELFGKGLSFLRKERLPIFIGGTMDVREKDAEDIVKENRRFVTTAAGAMRMISSDDYEFGKTTTFPVKGARHDAAIFEVVEYRK